MYKKNMIIIFVMLVLLSGCSYFDLFPLSLSEGSTVSDNTSSTVEEQSGSNMRELENIALSVNLKDSFNPFLTETTVNLSIMPLVYDPLVKINPEYGLEYYIAENIKISGLKCEITVKRGILFSDGSPLTSGDVVHSLQLAAAGGHYSHRLNNIASITATGEYSLEILLKTNDVFFAYNLDVPIIKTDSASLSGATGSGRYIIQKGSNSCMLKYNTYWLSDGKNPPVFNEINLVAVPDAEAGISGVETGIITISYNDDLSTGGQTRIGTAVKYITGNNMVFIGINSAGNNEALLNKSVRAAMSKSIDRQTALTKGYFGYGSIADIPFNPLLAQALNNNIIIPVTEKDTEAAKNSIMEAGYKGEKIFPGNSPEENEITLDLLIVSGNEEKFIIAEYIKEELSDVGIRVSISETSFDDYLLRIKSGDYDLYLGEVKLTGGMNLQSFLGADAEYIKEQGDSAESYYSFLSGNISFNDFIEKFKTENPFIPLFFKSSAVAYNRGIVTEILISPSDIYYNIENWNRK